MRVVEPSLLRALRELCDQHGALLIYDEIQAGLGRTGRLFAYEWARDAPDIMCVAKALGSSFPVGACLATRHAASGMTVGSHGSTYGGNPLAMAVGLAAFEDAGQPRDAGARAPDRAVLQPAAGGLKDRFPDIIDDIRGKGLLIGEARIPNNRVHDGPAARRAPTRRRRATTACACCRRSSSARPRRGRR